MKTTLFIISFFILGYCNPLFALDIEKLFMPGDVIAGHKKMEPDCKQCHERGREITQQQLCQDCHKKISADQQNKTGFHGLNEKAVSSDCRVCHTDHKGRDAQIVWLDVDRFNHQQTDYKLLGKHQQTECLACHKRQVKFRDALSNCIDCHKKDDVHEEKLGTECADCHHPKGWASEQFDHDKTKFKLRQAHQTVSCDLCHLENKFKNIPKDCISCHAIKDVHKNKFGHQCQSCHNQRKWIESIFNHNRDTLYKLNDAHQKVTCHACHKSKIGIKIQWKSTKKILRNCVSCHRLDDAHKGQNGDECQNCHHEKNWLESSFDHNRETEFSLKAAHQKASCQACHQQDEKGKKTDKACFSCHQHEDVHKGQEGKLCDNCHNDSSWWLENVRYDHELTEFPLIGQHAVIGCESCHLSSAFKNAESNCVDCHQQDDVHELVFGKECQSCHNSNDWLIWQFDHDKTDFVIKGAHEELHCHLCHLNSQKKEEKNRKNCIDCHRRDDVHDGNFGPDCKKCHTQDNFNTINVHLLRTFGR